jgi:hypothetical protein
LRSRATEPGGRHKQARYACTLFAACTI